MNLLTKRSNKEKICQKVKFILNRPYSPSVGVVVYNGGRVPKYLIWQSRIREAQKRFLYCARVQKYYTKYIRPCQKRHVAAIIPPLLRLVNMPMKVLF